MNSRIELVRKLHRRLCSWGLRTPIPAREYVGGPVPLLRNPQAINSTRLAIINTGLLLFTLLGILIDYLLDQKTRK